MTFSDLARAYLDKADKRRRVLDVRADYLDHNRAEDGAPTNVADNGGTRLLVDIMD